MKASDINMNEKMKIDINKILNRASKKGIDIKGTTYKINSFGNILMFIPRKKGNMIFTIFKNGGICTGATGVEFKSIEIDL